MPFPSYKEIEIPLLLNIYNRGGEVSSSSCYEPLGKEFDLTDEEMSILLSDGSNRLQWNNMVQWARNQLVDYKYLHNAKESGHGIWKLTQDGIKKAESLSTKLEIGYPDDVSETFYEGAVKRIKVNKYERSKTARDKCIDHYGCQCSVCNMDFEKTYGETGKDYIHVHHITPLSEIGERYKLDPVNDLRPVCPNCHAMIHRRKPSLTIEELKVLMTKAQKENESAQSELTQ
ncbi:hypothetical protein L370_01872 [Enterobacter sp. MGH 24]|uniref:winged helix-turn-helix domain-containing protein n=1 Tax=Enterobacter sp. MGH 24 TaxID=1329828 RepID=UPI0003BF48AD|nr:winged helix-turn-helix domain-containing protein [Enterobacter sp. MGH 24]ESN15811.1 hypothetical protein L370_01872 [Enterobacter sp. MGH 24]